MKKVLFIILLLSMSAATFIVSTVFPQSITIANSWNEGLMFNEEEATRLMVKTHFLQEG